MELAKSPTRSSPARTGRARSRPRHPPHQWLRLRPRAWWPRAACCAICTAGRAARKRAATPYLPISFDSKLVVAGDDRCLPFDASSVDTKRPADLATETTRILKPEGHLVVLTSSAADYKVYINMLGNLLLIAPKTQASRL